MKTIIWFGFVLGAMSAAGKVFIAEVGQTALLKCEVNQNYRLEWNYNGVRIFSVNIKTGFSSKGTADILRRSTLIKDKDLQISPVEEGDAGHFHCNVDRTTHEHTLNVVTVLVTPSTSLQKGSNAALQCLVKGPEQKTFQVQWEKPDGSTENSPTVQLKAVDASHAGSWTCTVTNKEGTFTVNRVITLIEPTPTPAAPFPNHHNPNIPKLSPNPIPGNNRVTRNQSVYMLLGISWWIWVATGVGLLILIILLIIVIVMVKRIKRKKKKLQKMKNARLKPTKYCQCKHQTAAPKPRQGRRRERPSALPLQPLLME